MNNELSVSGLYIYPLKSAAGLSLSTMSLDALGPRHDRRFMLTDREGHFLSQRKYPAMTLIQTGIDDHSLRIKVPAQTALTITLPTDPQRVHTDPG